MIKALLFIVSCAVAFAAAGAIAPRPPLLTAAVAAAAALGLTWIFCREAGERLDRPTWRSAVRFSMAAVGGALLCIAWAVLATGQLAYQAPSPYWALIYVLLAARETLAFHGYPLRRLNERWGYWPAQLTVALLFAIEHKVAGWSWMTAFVGSLCGSLLFGATALATRGIAASMGLHAAWNIGQSTFGPGTPTLRSTWMFALLCLICVAALNTRRKASRSQRSS